MKHWYCILFLIICSACKTPFTMQPQPLNAAVVEKGESKILQGASALSIDGYFVWGGSDIQGDDGKYHMLLSLWESGAANGSFTQGWVLESKIGYAVSDFPKRDFKFQKIILKGRIASEKKTLAFLSSMDGITWDIAHHPLFINRDLQLTNGTKVLVDRLERPQLLISKKGVRLVIYAACALDNVNPKNDGSSFNVQISFSKKIA